jgi:hypothetical protein
MTAFSTKAFWEDTFNVIDFAIVLVSVLDVVGLSGISFNAFRTFRVVRLFRLIGNVPSLEPLKIVIDVVACTLGDLTAIVGLLFLFMFIFATLGMQLFPGLLGASRAHYDSFILAFFSTFQVMTFDSWFGIMSEAMENFGPSACIYFIVWIVIGRYILMNLLLVLIFKSFEEIYQQREMAERAGAAKALAESAIEFSNPLQSQNDKSSDFSNPLQNILLDTESSSPAYEEEADNFKSSSDDIRDDTTDKGGFLVGIVSHPWFDKIVFAVILCNTLALALDTPFLDPDEVLDPRNDASMLQLLQILDIAFTVVFTLEAGIKIAAFGLVASTESYLSSNWNRMDFFVVIVSSSHFINTHHAKF